MLSKFGKLAGSGLVAGGVVMGYSLKDTDLQIIPLEMLSRFAKFAGGLVPRGVMGYSEEKKKLSVESNPFKHVWAAKNRGTYRPILNLGIDESTRAVLELWKTVAISEQAVGYYPMTAKKHGVCIIISNEHFLLGSTLPGRARDEYNLVETWRYLGYHIELYHDITSDKIESIFENIDDTLRRIKGENPELANDSFVCCILSHGNENCIFGTNSKAVFVSNIEKKLGKSRILKDKPKIFFIDACQGGEVSQQEECIEVVKASSHQKDNDQQNQQPDHTDLCTRTDSYVSFSTAFKDLSYTSEYGSRYIMGLCKTLCAKGKELTLDDVQKIVNEKVAKQTCYMKGNKKIFYSQQPSGRDQLRKKVHFFYEEKRFSSVFYFFKFTVAVLSIFLITLIYNHFDTRSIGY